jgi:hypothetical protein
MPQLTHLTIRQPRSYGTIRFPTDVFVRSLTALKRLTHLSLSVRINLDNFQALATQLLARNISGQCDLFPALTHLDLTGTAVELSPPAAQDEDVRRAAFLWEVARARIEKERRSAQQRRLERERQRT